MTRGRLTKKRAAERDQVDQALYALSNSLIEIDEVILRNRQALRRSPLVGEVLEPAVERLASIRKRVRSAQRSLGDLWADGQTRRWRRDD